MASFTGERLPEEPEEPRPEDCCGNGCTPCVLDVYQELLRKWKDECCAIKESLDKKISTNLFPVLSMTRYMPFQLVSIDHMTNDTNIYGFQAVTVTTVLDAESVVLKNLSNAEIVGGKLDCFPGQYVILKGELNRELGSADTKESAVITRAYTPLRVYQSRGKFDVMIKIYEGGRMSRFVSELQVGDVTFWRGPYGSFKYERNSYECILMLCAGTGIAPLYAIAKMVVDDEQEETLVRMAFACKSPQDILLRNEIRKLSSFWNFCVEIYMNCPCSESPRYGETFSFCRLGKDQVKCQIGKLENRKILVLICGPTSFAENMTEITKDCGVPSDHIHVF